MTSLRNDNDMLTSVWMPLSQSAAVWNTVSQVSNVEFWIGTVLIVLACEMDLIYFHILNALDINLI